MKAAWQGYIDVQSNRDIAKVSEKQTETGVQSSRRSVGDIFNREVKLRAKCYLTQVATFQF